MEKAKVYLGVPSYDNRVYGEFVTAMVQSSKTNVIHKLEISGTSWLTRNFNKLYCSALNLRSKGYTHFCLLHDDVIPQTPFWMDLMLDIMDREKADVLSAIVPIKDSRGFTSTGLDEKVGEHDQRWRIRRLTLHEVYTDFPPTFTHENILLNTGLLLIDITKPHAENIVFKFDDQIVPNPQKPGEFMAAGFPEDWGFSREANKLGLRLFATREIQATHMGGGRWSNAGIWGSKQKDE